MHVADTEEFRKYHGVELAAIAHDRFKSQGRGMLLASERGPGEWRAAYVVQEVVELAFSEPVRRAVATYNPAFESVLFVGDETARKLLKVSIEPA